LLTQQHLIALDWEYAATNHPLLDFAFFANNFNLETDWLHNHYPDSIRHPSINFQDVRRLGWLIEAVWYAKRYQANPTEAWLKWMDQALSNL